MNRMIRTLFVLSLAFAFASQSVLAEDQPQPRLVPNVLADTKAPKVMKQPKQEGFAEHVKLGIQSWYTWGQDEWEISFKYYDPEFFLGSGRSVLEWEDVDSLVTMIHGEVAPHPLFKISGRYGFGDIDDGQNTDTDYDSVPLGGIQDFKFSESVASTEGETSMFDIKTHFVLSELQGFEGFAGTLDFFVGYHYYTEELQDKDGIQKEYEGEQLNIPFADAGFHLDSSYDFEWSGISWGVRAAYPLLEGLEVSGSIALIALLDYEGEGVWNLRDDLRQDPSFTHEADEGGGVDASITLTAYPLENLGVQIGYRYTQWTAENGKDTTHFVGFPDQEATLDSVDSLRHGFFVGVFGRI